MLSKIFFESICCILLALFLFLFFFLFSTRANTHLLKSAAEILNFRLLEYRSPKSSRSFIAGVTTRSVWHVWYAHVARGKEVSITWAGTDNHVDYLQEARASEVSVTWVRSRWQHVHLLEVRHGLAHGQLDSVGELLVGLQASHHSVQLAQLALCPVHRSLAEDFLGHLWDVGILLRRWGPKWIAVKPVLYTKTILFAEVEVNSGGCLPRRSGSVNIHRLFTSTSANIC